MNAQEAIIQNVGKLTKLLKSKPESDVPLRDFEDTYRTLRGIKGFWDSYNWNEIEERIDADWIKIARSDKAFKEYYGIRKELDRLEAMV